MKNKQVAKYYKKGKKAASRSYKNATKSVNRFMKKNPWETLGIVAAIPVTIILSCLISSKISVARAVAKAKKK